MAKALILVDLQNDFFPGGALGVQDGDKILPVIQKLLNQKWDAIVASKDWHPADHGSFADTHGKKPGDHVILGGVDQVLWPKHCIQGTVGAEFASGWDVTKIQKVINKGTDREIDSYSAFFDNQHKKNTGLEDYLRKKNITELYLAGLATDYCVKNTTLDALELGFRVYVIKEGCRAVNLQANDGERALDEMKKHGAHILNLCETY